MLKRLFNFRLIFIWLALFFSGTALHSQEKYWVFFKDKNTADLFNEKEYFDIKAIQKRTRHNLTLNDSLCWPLDPRYVALVKQIAEGINQESRWLNAVSVFATPGQVRQLQNLDCVKLVQQITSSSRLAGSAIIGPDGENVELMEFQTERMQGSRFHQAGYTGEGIRIAVFDAGFPGVEEHPAFRHLMQNGRIIDTYDFIKKRKNVFYSSAHGTAVLSCIAGRYTVPDEPDSLVFMGLAQDAEFLLAKTERGFTEFISEEDNWIAAMEWAERLGADIISSSLGYTSHRYFSEEMDGQTSWLSVAANLAASRGILVINAAGNEGQSRWRTVAVPADADSVLAVGATNPYMDAATNFSSLGPASDGRLKPDVSAVGIAAVAVKKGYAVLQGTSFSAPLVAGFAACAWQMDTSLSNMELFGLLQQSGHLHPYFDHSHGYGIPQAGFFLGKDSTISPTIMLMQEEELLVVKIIGALADSIEKEGDEPKQRNLYYRIETPDNRIRRYGAVLAETLIPFQFHKDELENGDIITIHFEGFTTSFIY
ncbi:MAG: S8 family serine peptidase [Bacteroidia bacterium]